MAQLPSEDLNQVWVSVMNNLSSVRTAIPINKNQLRLLLVLIDQELETAETNIIQALPASEGKSWLIANAGIGRMLMEYILAKRREVL